MSWGWRSWPFLSTPTERQPKRHQRRAHNYVKNSNRDDRAKHFSAVLVRQKWPQIQVRKALVRHQEKFPHLEVVLHWNRQPGVLEHSCIHDKSTQRKWYEAHAMAWPFTIIFPSNGSLFIRIFKNRQLLLFSSWCYRPTSLLQSAWSAWSIPPQKMIHHLRCTTLHWLAHTIRKGCYSSTKHTLFNCRTGFSPHPWNLSFKEIFIFSQAHIAYGESGDVCPFSSTFLFKFFLCYRIEKGRKSTLLHQEKFWKNSWWVVKK